MPLRSPLIWRCSNPDDRKPQYLYGSKMGADDLEWEYMAISQELPGTWRSACHASRDRSVRFPRPCLGQTGIAER
jgi:hypothetical protein